MTHRALVRLVDWARRMTLWQRVLVAALPAAMGALAAQWHESCIFDRIDRPQSICVLEYFWYPPVMDVAFAVLVLAPLLGDVRRVLLRIAGLVGVSVLVHLLATDMTIGFRGTIDMPGVDSIFLNVIPVAIAASLMVAVCAVWLTGRSPCQRLWGCAASAGLVAAAAFLLPDLFDSTPAYLLSFGALLVWPIWHMGMAAALHCGLRTGAG